MVKRSLYTCFNAKCEGNIIVCDKGYRLASGYARTMSILPLRRGAPLELTVCQACPDYNNSGNFRDPVPPSERGWATVELANKI